MYFGSQFGKNLLWAEGELHRRRQALFHVVRLHADRENILTGNANFSRPAFSNAAIRDLTYVFYDSAHKVQILRRPSDIFLNFI